jgi:hypothetical protein
LNTLADGPEMYSVIKEEQDAAFFIQTTKLRARHLFEACIEETIKQN